MLEITNEQHQFLKAASAYKGDFSKMMFNDIVKEELETLRVK